MKQVYLILVNFILLLTASFAQPASHVPAVSGSGPLTSGSLLTFDSGSALTAIQENWGLNLSGDNMRPVKIFNSSLLVGYQSSGADYGINNALINGKVGIGTLSPIAPLDVNGNIQISNSLIPMGLMTELPNTSNPLINLSVNFRETNKNNNFLGAAFRIDTRQTSSPLFQWLYRAAGTDGENILMVLNQQGYLGVGTLNPDAKLAVQGTVHATEVLVDQKVPTPDYVFDKDYGLATLKEVKTYIDQNHHLPEIPSAAQVAKEGVNLGEMNTKLLKKIEELTLYLIEKDGEISSLSKQMKNMQKEIDQLKKKQTN